MAFLTKKELKTKTHVEFIDLITQDDDSTVEDIIDESIDVMKNYLYPYYDVDSIFDTTGDDRSKTILKYLKAIVVRELYVIRSRKMNEVAQINYDEAMNWLDNMGKGKIQANLPAKQVDTDGDGETDSDSSFLKFGGRANYENRL